MEPLFWNGKKCSLCNHYCEIQDNCTGVCGGRLNQGGELRLLTYGRAAGFAIDPIEKKPFYHFKPGTRCLSFGTPGCNFRCRGCQNADLSQGAKGAPPAYESVEFTSPRDVSRLAAKADGVAYTYSEPTIFFEYARDCILETRKRYPEKYHVFVSNGFFSKECWELIEREKLLDAIRIDLKSFSQEFYKEYCGARLQPVLDNLERVAKSDVHLEVINLVVPGENDSGKELGKVSRFVAGLRNGNVPLHFSRFYPMHEASGLRETPAEKLFEAKKIALEEGVKFVYVGNLGTENNTLCPDCGATCVERTAFSARSLMNKNACPRCGKRLAVVV